MFEITKYAVITEREGMGEDREVFDDLEDARTRAFRLSRANDIVVIVADIKARDLLKSDDWESFSGYGYDVYEEYCNGCATEDV